MAKAKKTVVSTFMNGLVTENPTFTLLLGMCPTLAITTAASSGVGMGLATTAVLVCSNLFISLLRNVIPEKVRIPSFIVVIASFVSVIEMLMKAYLPELSQSLGMYIPLIVVNCIIFARAEAFAFKNPPLLSLADGLGMGLGFTAAITLLSMIREILGSGKLFGTHIMGDAFVPFEIMLKVPGGFITLGLLLVLVNHIKKSIDKKGEASA